MDKPFEVTITWESDSELGDDYPRIQHLEDSAGNLLYDVRNLTDCPEDAIILRDLVSAEEIVEFIELGMKLATEGYTSIHVTDNHVDSIW